MELVFKVTPEGDKYTITALFEGLSVGVLTLQPYKYNKQEIVGDLISFLEGRGVARALIEYVPKTIQTLADNRGETITHKVFLSWRVAQIKLTHIFDELDYKHHSVNPEHDDYYKMSRKFHPQ
jgi:hypothetical protein